MADGAEPTPVEATDIELMLRVREGDVTAFRELARRYREPLRRYFAGVIADRSLADDYVQETLLRLWISRDRYEPTGRFSTYLFQIGKHYWLNQRKKVGREIGDDDIDAHLTVAPATASQPETILLERYQDARVRRAIQALPKSYRVVFEMSHLEGLKYVEIACRLGIPVGTVKSRMAEAVRRLRRALSGPSEGG